MNLHTVKSQLQDSGKLEYFIQQLSLEELFLHPFFKRFAEGYGYPHPASMSGSYDRKRRVQVVRCTAIVDFELADDELYGRDVAENVIETVERIRARCLASAVLEGWKDGR